MSPRTFTLYAPRADLHDRLARKEGDFVETLAELADHARDHSDYGVRIPIRHAVFGLLQKTIELAAGTIRVPVDLDGIAFNPTGAADLTAAADAYLEALATRCKGTPIHLDARREDPLFEIMGRLAGADGHESDADVLRLFGALTGGVYVGPRVFHVDVSNRCNTDCVYCWFHSELSAGRPDADRLDEAWRQQMLDYNLYARLIDDLAALKTTEDVVLSGKGEPLTHPRCLDMVRLAKSKEMAVTLFTNGLRFDEQAAKAVIEAGLDLLYVSLSAADARTYDHLHRKPAPGEFDRIRENVRRLVAMKREAKAASPRIVLVSILTDRNAGEVVPFARLAAELGVDRLRYQLAAIEMYNRSLALSPLQFARLKKEIPEARAIAEQAGIEVVDNISFQLDHAEEGSQDWSGDYFLERGCYAGWLFSRAWADAQVSFCCVPKPLGDLKAGPFAGLWTSDRYTNLRLDAQNIRERGNSRLDDGTTLLDARCTRCPNYEQIQWLFDLAARLHVAEWL